MPLVICRVLITLRIRCRMSRMLGIFELQDPSRESRVQTASPRDSGLDSRDYFAYSCCKARVWCLDYIILRFGSQDTVPGTIFLPLVAHTRPALFVSTYFTASAPLSCPRASVSS